MQWNVIHLAETTSTMDAASAHLRTNTPADTHGTIIVADTQSAGRGRHNRPWLSHAPGDLLASFILQARPSLVPYFPMLCGAAAARTVDDLITLSPSIKWPNDVLVDNRKVCGILAESWSDGTDTAVILGFGINLVFTPPAHDALRHPAANLNEFSTTRITRDDALARLQTHVADLFEWLDRGEPHRIHAEWSRRLATLGSPVAVAHNAARTDTDSAANGSDTSDTVSGIAEAVDETGRLLIRDAHGILHAVSAGDVSTVR